MEAADFPPRSTNDCFERFRQQASLRQHPLKWAWPFWNRLVAHFIYLEYISRVAPVLLWLSCPILAIFWAYLRSVQFFSLWVFGQVRWEPRLADPPDCWRGHQGTIRHPPHYQDFLWARFSPLEAEHLVVSVGRHRWLPSCYSERSVHSRSIASAYRTENPSTVGFVIGRMAILGDIVAQFSFRMIVGLDRTGHHP